MKPRHLGYQARPESLSTARFHPERKRVPDKNMTLHWTPPLPRKIHGEYNNYKGGKGHDHSYYPIIKSR